MTANSAPAATGTTVSTTVLADQTALLATTIRARPTSVGSAPKSAASKKTNSVGTRKATARTCGTVSTSNHAAIGTLARTTALTRSVSTITRLRSNRSASAPAGSPNIRYGSASSEATSEVISGEDVIE